MSKEQRRIACPFVSTMDLQASIWISSRDSFKEEMDGNGGSVKFINLQIGCVAAILAAVHLCVVAALAAVRLVSEPLIYIIIIYCNLLSPGRGCDIQLLSKIKSLHIDSLQINMPVP